MLLLDTTTQATGHLSLVIGMLLLDTTTQDTGHLSLAIGMLLPALTLLLAHGHLVSSFHEGIVIL